MKFTSKSNTNLQLNSLVLTYNDGYKWKTIPISLLFEKKIIYDTFYDKLFFSPEKDNFKKEKRTSTKVSICFCPKSFICIIYEGKWNFQKYKNNIMILENEKNETLELSFGNPSIRKFESNIMEFKESLLKYPDSLFIDYKYKNHIYKPNIVPLIDYLSTKKDNINISKYSLLVGKDTYKYLEKFEDKIRDKNGFIIYGDKDAMINIYKPKIIKVD
ncbi:MAG: hypothetical protein CMF62_03790 [Magnetococcales bacterium]|nr:hypothetical protein [Magnetococcales bacterium]|tara:strand:+ start:41390 stop:42037 length:648 start_codon:yes stop_codon:yes gene_type:complete